MKYRILIMSVAVVALLYGGFGFGVKTTSANALGHDGLWGSYALHFTGTILLPEGHPLKTINGPCSMVGIMNLDRSGTVSGTSYTNFSGVAKVGTWGGVYSVDDGIVTLEVTAMYEGSLPITFQMVGVLADNEKRMEITFTGITIESDQIPPLPDGVVGMVSTGTMIRQ
jgi:hypothetical protein